MSYAGWVRISRNTKCTLSETESVLVERRGMKFKKVGIKRVEI